ncbi:unnamed protein product [Effrenium voratum]|nr:unnamed protein product [Effrenium voratum]
MRVSTMRVPRLEQGCSKCEWQDCFAMTSAQGDSVSVDRLMIKVLTPEGLQLKTVVSEISLPGLEGRLGILRGHIPLVAPLACGLLRYKRQGKWVPVVLRGGYASVQDNVVTVLTNDAERSQEIPTVEEAREELDNRSEELATVTSRTGRLAAADAVRLASARLQAAMLIAKEK